MTVQALGYIGFGAASIDDWSRFATRQLGMQEIDRAAAGRSWRMDDRRQRLFLDRTLGERQRLFGWEVADAASLDALAARLETAGVPVRREPAALADQRFVAGLISFADPFGNRLEAFHGPLAADEPFRPGRSISGFRTGPLGLGHAVLMVPDIDKALAFYRDVLGFRISDFIRAPFAAYFLHVNDRHHSLALFQGSRSAFHHVMIELYSLDDIGQGYDIALGEKDQVAVTLGRHANDLMTSFYMRSPSEFLVEYGWGGREVDDATWQPQELSLPELASYWGHAGLFQAIAGNDAPPPDAAPPPAPPPGRRAPLQVMDGNYQQMSGVCPWWDQVSGRN